MYDDKLMMTIKYLEPKKEEDAKAEEKPKESK